MLKIRFMRAGRKKQPFYKIVVTDKNNPPKSGRFKEMVGFYNPFTKECKIDKEKTLSWIEKGAQPTDVVKNILIKKEIIRGKKTNVVSLTKKRTEKIESKKKEEEKIVKDKKEAEAQAAVPQEEVVEEEKTEEVVKQEEEAVEEKEDKKEEEK